MVEKGKTEVKEKKMVVKKKKETAKPKTENLMRKIKVEKITINMGIGVEQEKLKSASAFLEKLVGQKVVQTVAKKRLATWKIRPGLPIGLKVSIRGKKALELVKNFLQAVDNKIKKSSFCNNGFSFGIKEYIDIPGAKYDPKVGIIGMDVCVTLTRAGFRVRDRKLKSTKIPARHSISAEDAIKFATEELKVELI